MPANTGANLGSIGSQQTPAPAASVSRLRRAQSSLQEQPTAHHHHHHQLGLARSSQAASASVKKPPESLASSSSSSSATSSSASSAALVATATATATGEPVKINQRVLVNSSSGLKPGTLRFLGQADFGGDTQWAGVELDEPTGKNDGSVAGKRYFNCAPNYGLFAPIGKVQKLTPRLELQFNKAGLPHSLHQLNNTHSSTPIAKLTRSDSRESISSVSSVRSSKSGLGNHSGITRLPVRSSSNLHTTYHQYHHQQQQQQSESVFKLPQTPASVLNHKPMASLADTDSKSSMALRDKDQKIERLIRERDGEREENNKLHRRLQELEERLVQSELDKSRMTNEADDEIVELKRLSQELEDENKKLTDKLDQEKQLHSEAQFKYDELEVLKGDLESQLQDRERRLSKMEQAVNNGTSDSVAGSQMSLLSSAGITSKLDRSATTKAKFEKEICSLKEQIVTRDEQLIQLRTSLEMRKNEVKNLQTRVVELERNLKTETERNDRHLKKIDDINLELKASQTKLTAKLEENEVYNKQVRKLRNELRNAEEKLEIPVYIHLYISIYIYTCIYIYIYIYTVLLGHNGAGKTTLIDIISGHNRKTSGHIIIDGYDIDTNPDQARRRVGFCPQFDVLFERLTVEEHLYFYGIIKGARKELKDEMLQLLQQSDLIEHRDKLSKTLSGGYKRKLSLAIAMIAGSKVLILDEPTSGMDPESRRKVWDFLQLIRRDRLILMTTHHMEEADALGDRIAIMSGGQVKCCGSSLFLKKVFNAGYHLRISKSATSWDQAAFDEIIGTKYNLHEKLENCTPHELMYQFDADETEKVLPKLFEDLELQKERVGIFGFGVTVSTMDDVFMKIGIHFKDVEAEEMQMRFNLANNKVSSNVDQASSAKHRRVANYYKQNMAQQAALATTKPASNSDTKSLRYPRIAGPKLFRQHMRALMAKRYNHARKNWFQIVWIFSISLFCILSIILLLDFIIFREEITPEWKRPVTLSGMGYGTRTEAIYQYGLNEDGPVSDPHPFVSSTSTTSPSANGATSGSSLTTVTPSSTTSMAPSTTTALNFDTETSTSSGLIPNDDLTPTTIINSASDEPFPTASRLVATDSLSATESHLNSSAKFLNKYWGPEATRNGVTNILTYTDANTEMIDRLTREFANFREHYIVGGEKTGKKYVAWYNGEATHALPISMNMMMNSILKQFTDLIEGDHPVKRSRISLTHHALSQINTLIAFLPHLGRLINLVFLPFSLAFITSYFVIFPTHERVTKSKHLQLMTGLSCRTFWLSHFLFDLLIYSAYTTLMLVIYYVWDRMLNDRRLYFANFEHSLALILLVFLFVFAALPFAYIFSFLAKKPTSAFSSLCVLTILTGTATLTLVSLYELKYEDNASTSVKTLFTIFLWSSRLLPSVSLLVGLQKLFALNTTRHICINISTEVLDLLCRYINSPLVDDELRVLRPERCCRQVCGDNCYDQWPFFWSGWFGINAELAMLVLDAILLWSLLVLIECRSLRRQIWALVLRSLSFRRRLFSASFRWKIPRFVDNKELHKEHTRIEKAIRDGKVDQYSMVVSNLTKVYSNDFTAVDQLSFIVDKGEFFGLLGVNGAGKSTTFKMLTGELEATSGTAWISHYDLEHMRRKYLTKIGYCPQMDALIDHMTGNEMLTLFARLRGVPEHFIKDLVEDTVDKLGLTRMCTIDCNNYSGGNKRRLSVGLALIGAPDVIFLDEPTSGVDPRSRRRLWSTLIEFQQLTRSAVVMTSHSMNECESLCDRVAIMVAGQFQVLGSIQYLRTKLSQGFSLILKLKSESLNQHLDQLESLTNGIHKYMMEAFGSTNISLKDIHQTMVSYHIAPHAKLTWSKMLVRLEQAKRDLDLEDYQITSDASLESIFLSLAKKQNSTPIAHPFTTSTLDTTQSNTPTSTTNRTNQEHQSITMT